MIVLTQTSKTQPPKGEIMKHKIKHRFSGKVIATAEGETLKKALEKLVIDNADLRNADLRYADLWYADLRNADLRNADLRYADLRYADLRNADIEFHQFPSIRLISSITLGNLSDKLTLELMRRDAFAHPKPKKFKLWAKGGACPYQNEERFWFFHEKKELWRAGKPQMRDSDLILTICKEKGWEISDYLKIKKKNKSSSVREEPTPTTKGKS